MDLVYFVLFSSTYSAYLEHMQRIKLMICLFSCLLMKVTQVTVKPSLKVHLKIYDKE